MVNLIRSDLDFMLEQILIAEANAWTTFAGGEGGGGTPLVDLVPDANLSLGLRTVDGTFNNLLPGRDDWGTADQPFPRLTDPQYRDVGDFDPDGPGGSMPPMSGDYQVNGNVVDPTIRIISNLIVDSTTNNLAAAAAAGIDVDGADDILGNDDDWTPPSTPDELDIPNVAPDAGLSAPFNSWMTLFGQFFDHGLDLVNKGGSGVVFMPLSPDDPLYRPGGNTNFMLLTRASRNAGPDGVLGTNDDTTTNQTTPFVDQNQTYTSHASHQALLREYVLTGGSPVATGRLLDGAMGGLATWGDIKEQARTILGIDLQDADVTNLPLLATDQYGRLILKNGHVQVVMQDPVTGAISLVEGDPSNPIDLANAVRTGHAALDDIAHTAAPRMSNGQMKTADADSVAGLDDQDANTYDDELLDAHFATGDGRGNENIGLTAVHTVFHAEHNRVVDQIKSLVVNSGDAEFQAKWTVAGADLSDGIQAHEWHGERLFQAARLTTEMQYQHLVFEEFARKIQPQIDIFSAYDTTINPAIFAEFAHTVYRFGHSMLNDTIARLDQGFQNDDITLLDAFLNPLEFNKLDDALGGNDMTAAQATAAIVRGMSRQVGNQIDEFVTDAVRNNLLGLPLDLAALNIARGRDTGIPAFNEVRRQFFEMTQDSQLAPYTSWTDFAGHLKNELSIINFIAAYGTHASVTSETTVAGKRAAAIKLVLGDDTLSGPDKAAFDADRLAFLNAEGIYATAKLGGLNDVDFWVGGLAEETMPFGGMLGSTFAFVFEAQLEALQSGDRFYYLARLAGTNLLTELENQSFASLIMRNTEGLNHLPADVFSTPNYILEVDRTKQFNDGLGSNDPTGATITTPLVIRNNPATPGTDTNYLRFTGDAHVVLGGTSGADILIAGEGDDTVYGDGGNDRLEGGFGNDNLLGGAGDDIITDSGGDDVIKGGDGDDTIQGGNGLNLILGGTGSDFIVTGEDSSEVFAGEGNDFIYGSKVNEGMQGNEGDDWIEIGTQDGAPGDNFDPFGRDQIDGHDVFLGDGGFDEFVAEGGDDIMVGSPGINRNEGMSGYDWVTYKNNTSVYADLLLAAFDETPIPPSQDTAIERYAEVEGLSGSQGNDVLLGDDDTSATLPLAGQRGSLLTRAGIARINGLSQVVTDNLLNTRGTTTTADDVFDGGNVILGGDGNDTMTGRGGDDILDGDRWLNVRISVVNQQGDQIDSANSMKQLEAKMFSGQYKPSQLRIVREILTADGTGDTDTAVYAGSIDEYDITLNANGTYTIAHIGGTQADGVDTLRNIERVRFLNNDPLGEHTEIALTPNVAAQGFIAVSDQTPTEGSVLTSDLSQVEDTEGVNVATTQWRWQVFNGTAWVTVHTTTGGADSSFTPTQAEVGFPIRVVLTFMDNGAHLETFTSLATDVLGDLFIGLNDALNGDRFAGTAGADDARGLAGNDTLNGLAGEDILDGGDGNDTLNGGAGNDILMGGLGVDVLDGGQGGDEMDGGAGNDTYVFDDLNDRIADSAGTDLIRTAFLNFNLGTFTTIENLTFIGTGNFEGTGNALVNVLTGGAGADLLDGLTGADRMVGLGGSDTYRVDHLNDNVVEAANAGADLIELSALTYTNKVNVERIVFVGTGNVTITGQAGAETQVGGAGNDVLNGLGGNDILEGNDGNDRLVGGGAADTLRGGIGEDVLNGDAGNDFLHGGVGNDSMNGGTGNDVFVFEPSMGQDTITGFDSNPTNGQDRLDIRLMGITAAEFGAQVRITADGTSTVITFDTDENGIPDGESITLLAVAATTVTSADFIL